MVGKILKKITRFAGKTSDLLQTKKLQYLNCSLLSESQLKELRVFATTVVRGSGSHEMTGFLLELDWENNRVKEKIPIPLDSSHPFWNARGGNRGGRGVFVHNGILYVATAMSILKFDSQLNQVGEIVHPYLAGLHEIYINSEGIWITSTVHDLVLKLDFQGNLIDEWWGSESKILQQEFGFSGRQLNLNLDFPTNTFTEDYARYCQEERLHLNSIVAHEGEVYILASRLKAFIKIRPEPEKVIFQDNLLASPHNSLVTLDNRIIINDTGNQGIRIYELSSGKRSMILSTAKDGKRGLSDQFAKAGWQRGLAHVKDSVYLVGTSPATVFEVDIDKGLLGQICQIDTDIKHCIHGLTITYEF
ncbi:hypothetical protein [Microcoleus sp. FACHB-672]|uniref:hypothetical protein n=1 Tax=Microcoleus sp. FACHB-672 TaxID=2692825 RepID=UPI0016864D20|nr:hypothetical protein [Microcoleus sp. FACHB-672]MBD2039818.1 hypothetical protein [Microcoleus sp. FACHB-672]